MLDQCKGKKLPRLRERRWVVLVAGDASCGTVRYLSDVRQFNWSQYAVSGAMNMVPVAYEHVNVV